MTQIINIIVIIVWLLIALLSLGLLNKAKREYEGHTRYMREFIMRQKKYRKKDAGIYDDKFKRVHEKLDNLEMRMNSQKVPVVMYQPSSEWIERLEKHIEGELFYDYQPGMETEFSYDEASNISVCLNCGFTIGGKVKGLYYCPRCGCRLKKARSQTREED